MNPLDVLVRNMSVSEMERLAYIQGWTLPTGETVSDLITGDLFIGTVADSLKQAVDDGKEPRALTVTDRQFLTELSTEKSREHTRSAAADKSLRKMKDEMDFRVRALEVDCIKVVNQVSTSLTSSVAQTLWDLGYSPSDVRDIFNTVKSSVKKGLGVKSDSLTLGRATFDFKAMELTNDDTAAAPVFVVNRLALLS